MTKDWRDDAGASRAGSTNNPTRKIDRSYGDRSTSAGSGSEDLKTQLYRSELNRSTGETDPTVDQVKRDPMADPVVGWLVVIDGPGRGAALQVGYGRNAIGRPPNARISLDYGDQEVSRTEHAVLTYDPRGRKFYLQGGGSNLIYIEGRDDPVLTPTVLSGGEELLLGKTKLKFVPFCGPDFDWHAG